MSGHSKWSTIKRKKGAADAKRGKLFSRLAKEITVAARVGGGDTNANPRLRLAVQAARTANMPNDNIDRAIKRGTGEIEGVTYEEAIYEAYGPGGVAICIEALTDNRNRTTPEIRHLLERFDASLTEPGAVLWMFERKGLIVIEQSNISEDDLFEIVIDAGAEDMKDSEGVYEIYTATDDLGDITEELQKRGIEPAVSEVGLIPNNVVSVDVSDAKKLMKLMEEIEDHDDVQKVSANFDIPHEVMEELAAQG